MKNGRYIKAMIYGVGSTAIAVGTLGSTVLEKLNEDETDRVKRIKNTVGFYAACFAAGFITGTIIENNENQLRMVEIVQSLGR